MFNFLLNCSKFWSFVQLFADFFPSSTEMLQVTADVLEAALEGVKQLAGARGDQHHLKLQYVESAQTQVKMVVKSLGHDTTRVALVART